MQVVLPGTFLLLATLVLFGTLYVFFAVSSRYPAFGFAGVLMYSWYSKWMSALYQSLVKSYNFETGAITTYNNSSITFLIYNMVMLTGTILAVIGLQKATTSQRNIYQITAPSKKYAQIGLLIVFGVMGLEWLNIIASGAIALPGNGVDRATYWTKYAKLPLNVVFGELALFVPLMSLVLLSRYPKWRDKKMHRYIVWAIGAYFLFLLAYGQRFHGLIIPLLLMLGFVMFKRTSEGKPNISPKTVATATLYTALLLLFGLFAISHRGIADSMGGISAFFYRILVLQGGPVWQATEIASNGPIGTLSDLFDRSFLTVAVGNTSIIEAYADGGVNLALALPSAVVLVADPLMVALVCFLYGLAYGAAMFALWRSMAKGRLFSTMVASYVMLWVHSIYGSGTLEPLLDIKLWLFVFFLLGANALRSIFAQNAPQRGGRHAL